MYTRLKGQCKVSATTNELATMYNNYVVFYNKTAQNLTIFLLSALLISHHRHG